MNSLTIIEWAEKLRQDIATLGAERPEQAYLVAHQLSKIGDEGKKTFKDQFQSFYDTNKELPGWFSCKVTNRKTYNFEENSRWRVLKAEMDHLESQIKKATDSGVSFFDQETGEEIKPVFLSQSEVYSVSRK